jgi:hypothetical protein
VDHIYDVLQMGWFIEPTSRIELVTCRFVGHIYMVHKLCAIIGALNVVTGMDWLKDVKQ